MNFSYVPDKRFQPCVDKWLPVEMRSYKTSIVSVIFFQRVNYSVEGCFLHEFLVPSDSGIGAVRTAQIADACSFDEDVGQYSGVNVQQFRKIVDRVDSQAGQGATIRCRHDSPLGIKWLEPRKFRLE